MIIHDSRSRSCGVSRILLLTLLVQGYLAEDVFFFTEPEPYYYSLPGHLTIVPCLAVSVNSSRDAVPIDATPYKNNQPLLLEEGLPDRHELRNTMGVIDGVLVRDTRQEDAGAVYSCRAERDGEVFYSRSTRIFVGDGRPLPVGGVMQDSQDLYSVSLSWHEARVPSSAPITSYQLTIIPQDGRELFTVDVGINKTSVDLTDLTPDTTYLVALAGNNSYGLGNLSEYTTIMTLTPAVPKPPTHVMVQAVIGKTSTSLIVSWTQPRIDPEAMTPISGYIIYYGPNITNENVSMSEVVQGGSVSEYTITGVTIGGEIGVGVASVNSAGESKLTLYQHTVVVGCEVVVAPEHGSVSQSGLATGSAANYSCKVGYVLTGNKSRTCNEQGYWTKEQPSCVEMSPEGRTFLVIVIISLAVVVALVLVIVIICILIFVFRRKSKKMGRKGRAIATFKNASPPLKRQQPKPISVGNYYSETGPGSTIGLEVLNSSPEPRVAGTPPPPDPTTFQSTPSPPSSSSANLPPSYSDLEQSLATPSNGHNRGYPNQLSSNSSPPSQASESEMTATNTPPRATYLTEPLASGSASSPHPPINTQQNTSNGTSSPKS